MNAADQKHIWDGLKVAEQVEGDEFRQAVGQGLNSIMKDEGKNDLVTARSLKMRALAVAWIASPESFGGRTLRQILADVGK